MHEVLVNRLGGLSLPRKSVVRLTDRPDMTLDVYCGRKTSATSATSYVLQGPFSYDASGLLESYSKISLVLDKTSYSYLGLIFTLKMSCCGTREQFCATKGAFNTLNFKKKKKKKKPENAPKSKQHNICLHNFKNRVVKAVCC